MPQQQHVINNCIELLQQVIALVKLIDETIFVSTSSISPRGSIGAHLRHILDFYDCLLAGLESGQVDYNRRKRDPQIEGNSDYAIEKIEATIQRLRLVSFSDEQRQITVSTEQDPTGSYFWCYSSVLRELVFLESHTVHHYSLIAMILRLHGIEPAEGFGVAASTLSYWNEATACAL